MRSLHAVFFITVLFALTACNREKSTRNPLISDFDTPFEVPPFDKIDTSHFIPAFMEGIRQHDTEIRAIVSNAQPPDFDNTILAYDASGKLLDRVSKVFYNLNECMTTKAMQAIARDMSPILSRHHDDVALNKQLFDRIRKVYDQRTTMNLDSQQIRVVEKYYRDFERKGAMLPDEKKERLRAVNESLSMLSLQFGDNLLAETTENYALVLDKESDLDGLPAEVVAAAAETAREKGLGGKWVFTLSRPSLIPFLQYARNRDLREKIFRAYIQRGNNGGKSDNKEIVAKIVGLRAEKAALLGFSHYASYILEQNMAQTPEAVYGFLNQLWTPALEMAKTECTAMQQIVDRDGGGFRIQPWDWWYYAEIIRVEKFDLDENELRPYFSLGKVRDGMFKVAENLYGITFHQRTDLPIYHPDLETFEVKEQNGSHLGVLYLDYFPRDGKQSGAWCTEFRTAGWEGEQRVYPVVSITCNFTKPGKDTPALLSWDETNTLFHEFGHALHSLFTEGRYARTAGVVPMDYVELPSQIMENWASDPEVLKVYAFHYQTKEPIPDHLLKKIENSARFNQGFSTVEYLAASFLDMDYHMLDNTGNLNVIDFETSRMSAIGLIREIVPRYRSTYFGHIFNSSYAAGYYVYIWAAVLDADAFQAFKESGDIYNKSLAASFRKFCLAGCGDDEGMVQYRKFRGKDPNPDALLKRRGLK